MKQELNEQEQIWRQETDLRRIEIKLEDNKWEDEKEEQESRCKEQQATLELLAAIAKKL